MQWTLTYSDTSTPEMPVQITEYPDDRVTFTMYIIMIGSQTCVGISEASLYILQMYVLLDC